MIVQYDEAHTIILYTNHSGDPLRQKRGMLTKDAAGDAAWARPLGGTNFRMMMAEC